MSYTGDKNLISGYQDSSEPQACKIVNAITKVEIQGVDEPILLIMNYATLIPDEDESESLCQPFNLMVHGVQIDMVLTK